MGNRDLFLIIQDHRLIRNAPDIFHINQKRTMSPQKASILRKLFAQLIQAAVTFKTGSALQVKYKGTSDYLTVYQLFQNNPGNPAFAAQDQAALLSHSETAESIRRRKTSSPIGFKQ